MATIRDVSKESGLSIATVSRALSNPEKVSKASLRKVQAAIDKLQYRPNMLSQKFRNKQANTIVVLVPDFANMFFAKVIRGIKDVAQKNGFSVLLGDTQDTESLEKEYIHLVETRQADGIIQLRPYNEHDSLLPKPHVLAVNACGCEGTPYPAIRIDNVEAAKKVVDYLVDIGHRRIGVISGLKNNPHTRDRMIGYKASLDAAGIRFDDSLITEGDFTLWSGLNASEQFTRMTHKPTAIFCMNDEMAIGAMKGLKSKGIRVPEDISITGFDDLDVSNYSDPPLTTIAQPAEKLGEKSAQILIQLIKGEEVQHNEIILPHEFVIRQSSMAIQVEEQGKTTTNDRQAG